jgi:glucose-1-phosphate cytidylyltransferase
LAGGMGTRLVEETKTKPKPMIKIGNKPIIWHIMKYYSNFGINNFIICLGYKGYLIKKNLKLQKNWNVKFVNTGLYTMTGGRLKKVEKFIKGENFCFTYGDGLSNINIIKEIKFHKKNKKLVTIAAVKPPGRFGSLQIIRKNLVKKFIEKPLGDNNWINGGFFVVNKKAIKFIKNNKTKWEEEPLQKLCKKKQVISYKHNGFWHPMDTLRDKKYLNDLWKKNPPWKNWF